MTELLQIQVVCTGKIGSTGKFDRQCRVAEGVEDIRDDVLLSDSDAEDLTLAIDTDDSTGGFVICSDKDGLARNAVHVDADSRFQVVEMNESVFRDEEDDAVSR